MPGAVTVLEPIAADPRRGVRPPPPPPASPTPVLVLAAAGAVALAGFLAGVALPEPAPDTPPPAPPAAVEPDTLPISSEAPGGRVGPYPLMWNKVAGLDRGGIEIADMLVVDELLVVAGRDGRDAAIWITTLSGFNPALSGPTDVFVAGDGPAREIHALAGDGSGMIAVGAIGARPAIWLGASPDSWRLVSPDESGFDLSLVLVDVAKRPGGAAVAVAAGPGDTTELWASEDGRRWRRAETPNGVRPVRVVVHGEAFFAAGSIPGDGTPAPAAWRSVDGQTWTTMPGMDAAWAGGAVTDLTATPEGLVAVGVAFTDADRLDRAAVWASADGEEWVPRALDEDALRPRRTVVEVEAVERVRDEWRATIDGPGGIVTIRSGTVAPGVALEDVARDAAGFRAGDRRIDVTVGDELALSGSRFMTGLAPYGSRLVAVGTDVAPATRETTPMVWSSDDGGATWEASAVGEGGVDLLGGLVPYGDVLLATGSGPDGGGSQLWIAEPDTAAVEAAAIATVERFAVLVDRGFTHTVVDMLAADLPLEPDLGRSAWPGLPTSPRFWQEDAGHLDLDTDAVVDFVGYAVTAPGLVLLSDCTARVRAATDARAAVHCDFETRRTVLEPLGIPSTSGRLAVALSNGAIADITLDGGAQLRVWERLSRWAATHQTETWARGFDAGPAPAPRYTPAAAAAHFEAAEALAAAALAPGPPRPIATPFGPARVRLVADTTAPGSLETVQAIDDGFVGFDRAGLWTTSDGVRWTAVPVPDDVGEIVAVVPGEETTSVVAQSGDTRTIWRADAEWRWERVPALPDDNEEAVAAPVLSGVGPLTGLASGHLGHVAWGSGPDPVLLWSADGRVWEPPRFELPLGPIETGITVRWVVVGDDTIVVGLHPPIRALFSAETLVLIVELVDG